MLIRINEGSDGVVEYLIHGRKQGREYERDVIDQRIILDGNINMLDTVIRAMDVKQGSAKYKHITLGLAENNINEDQLQKITARFKELLLNAYDENEVCFYAEAHIPKLTHEPDYTTGIMKERLPHIHIVIPITNMLTNKYLNPLGYKDTTYIDAIQEKINIEFGLKSPKDSMARVNVSLEQRKGDNLSVVDFKRHLESQISAGEINTYAELRDSLEKLGTVKIRNEGKENEYLNIHFLDSPKGINLKEFNQAYFAKSIESRASYASQNVERIDKLVNTWLDSKSYEVKLVNPYQRKKYKLLRNEDKEVFLNDLIIRDEEKINNLLSKITVDPNNIKLEKYYEPRRQYAAPRPEQLRAAAVLQSYLIKNYRPQETTPNHGRLRDVSDLNLVQNGISDVLLPSHAQNSMGKKTTDDFNVRWSRTGDSANAGSTRRGSVSQETKASINGVPATDYNAIPAAPVMAYLQRQGIVSEQADFQMSIGSDGKPRIIYDEKIYNITDFFTKKLKFSFEQTRSTLNVIQKQVAQSALPAAEEKFRFEFIRHFSALKEQKQKDNKAFNDDVRKQWAKERAAIQHEVRNRRMAIMKLPNAQQRYAKAELEKYRLDQLDRLRTTFKPKMVKLMQEAPKYKDAYTAYLQGLAGRGGVEALAELRRLAEAYKPSERAKSHEQFLTGRQKSNVFLMPSYEVDSQGNVLYKKQNKVFVIDGLKNIIIQSNSFDDHVFAMRLAAARYGSEITIQGNQKYIDTMLKAAKSSGLTLNITAKVEGQSGQTVHNVVPNFDKAQMKPKSR
jgi:hypothetical protein